MPDLTVWPTDGADGSVSSEARWRKMARLWVPSGVDFSPLGIGGGSGALAPTLAAGPTINVAIGGAWLDGHYAELTAPASIPATANGLLVVRFTPADNHAELLYRDAAVLPPTQTAATWELAIAKMAAGALTDLRRSVLAGGTGVVPACVLRTTTFVAPTGTSVVPYSAAEILDTDTMHDMATNQHRITFRTPGVYVVSAFATWNPAVTAGAYRYQSIRLNGATVLVATRNSGATGIAAAEATPVVTLPFVVGDYVEHVLIQDSGASNAISDARFSAVMVAPTPQA